MPYFEVANACMLTIYGTAAACVWLCRLCLCCFAGVRPVLIVSVPILTRNDDEISASPRNIGIYMILFEQNCNNLKMAAIGRNM